MTMREREAVKNGGMKGLTRRTAEFTAYLEANYPGLSLDEAEEKYRHQKRAQEYNKQMIDNIRNSKRRGIQIYLAIVALVLLFAYLFL